MTFKMKYEIIPRHLTGPSLRRPCIPLDTCRFVVAHDTGNPGSTAAGNVAYYERSRDEAEASAQIFVDDKEIIECIPFLTGDPEKAWHVRYNPGIDNEIFGADANDAAGGVEMCYGGGMNIYESYKRYIWVLAYSCYRFGLNPATDISGHYILDPTRKVDPMNALKLLGKTFDEFVLDVVNEYNDCLQSEEAAEMTLDQGVATTIINTFLKPSWDVADIQFKAAKDSAKAAAWDTQRDYYKWLADSLRDASGLPREQ
jgi:N-acetylmuramoyl-L-alanine amidase CwlA